MTTTLVTGGAGFIGSHVADVLLDTGREVRALDVLHPQVHGEARRRPRYLDRRVELLRGDVRDADALQQALEGVDEVVHLAAAVGVGQSMAEPARYVSMNSGGTAVLLEALRDHDVDRLVVASSMSIYGEGLYETPDGGTVHRARRDPEDMEAGRWDPRGPQGEELQPVATPESKRPDLESVYALTKYDQERLCLLHGDATDTPVVALRYFNAYGPRQALGNPYTGVLAIFATRILNGNPPVIFEDGEQKRDFVHVRDVAQATRLALEQAPEVAGEVFNVGSGTPRTVREVAGTMLRALNAEHLDPDVPGDHRVGDVRHCYADIARARKQLGFEPQVGFEAGVDDLVAWLAEAEEGDVEDRFESMRRELTERSLVR